MQSAVILDLLALFQAFPDKISHNAFSFYAKVGRNPLPSKLFREELEFITQVQEEVRLLRTVTIAQAGPYGTEDGIIVIGNLPA